MRRRLSRARDVTVAFIRIGWLEAVAYPVAFVQQRLQLFGALAVFAVLAGLVEAGSGDYLGFVVVGLAASEVLDAGTIGLSQRLGTEINTGRFETYLTEPVAPAFIPIGIVLFELIARVFTGAVVIAISIPMGANYEMGPGVLTAIGLTLLGSAAVLGVAVAGSSVRVLTKRSDPVLAVYTLAARFLGGVYFPVDQLPDAIEPLSLLVPHTYVTTAARELVLADSPLIDTSSSAGSAAVALVVLTVLTLPLGLWLFRRAIDTGRRLGILSGY